MLYSKYYDSDQATLISVKTFPSLLPKAVPSTLPSFALSAAPPSDKPGSPVFESSLEPSDAPIEPPTYEPSSTPTKGPYTCESWVLPDYHANGVVTCAVNGKYRLKILITSLEPVYLHFELYNPMQVSLVLNNILPINR